MTAAPTVLITLGRLPKGLELARAFSSAGCRVIIAEPHLWHLSRVSSAVAQTFKVTAPNDDLARYLDELEAIVRKNAVDLVVPVSDETMYVCELHGRLPARARVYAPPLSVVLQLHDKLAFARLAASYGLAVPETHPTDTADAAALVSKLRCVTKPRWSSAGVGLRILAPGDPLPVALAAPAAVSAAPRKEVEPHVLQAFVPGEEFSTFSIACEGRVLGTVVYRGLIMSGTVAVCFERLQPPPPSVTQWVERFAAASRHTGFLSFDFRLDEAGQPLAIECNPRTTSGIHFVAPQDLARAILQPDEADRWTLRSETRLQQFYPALTEVQFGKVDGMTLRQKLALLFGVRDVCWSPRDPLPLLLMPLVSVEILSRTLLRGESFGEASTVDIARHIGAAEWQAVGAERPDSSSPGPGGSLRRGD
jgi:predicted ATP-grasp superfamily ATP-dependent carboligase